MGEGRKFERKTRTRPTKALRERARRVKIHKKRLVALGLPEDKVAKMDAKKIRALIRHPARVAKKATKK